MTQDVFNVVFLVGLFALGIYGFIRRRNRRRLMTPTERALDDIREELAALRRQGRGRR